MVARVSFVCAGEAEAEVLLLFGQFVRFSGFRFTQVIDPKDAALSFLEGAWRTVSGGGKKRPHEIRHGTHLEFIAPGEGDSLRTFESGSDSVGFLAIKFEQR